MVWRVYFNVPTLSLFHGQLNTLQALQGYSTCKCSWGLPVLKSSPLLEGTGMEQSLDHRSQGISDNLHWAAGCFAVALSKQLCAILCISLESAGASQHKQLISACPGFKKCRKVHLFPLHHSLGQRPCQAGHICDICGNLGQLCRLGILRSGRVVPKEKGKLLSFPGVS